MQARGREALGSQAQMQLSSSKGLFCMRKHTRTRGLVVGSPHLPRLYHRPLGHLKKKIPFFCVLMYKGKDQLSTSKSGVLKGGRAVGRPAGASVLCLFPIPWPEAMVCIFRTTAGSGQAGDLSSGFITARRMTHRADGALRSGCASARSRPLRPARSSPRPPPRCPKPEL